MQPDVPPQHDPFAVPQPQVISAPVMEPAGQQIMIGQPQSTNAIAGLVLGIVGIFASFFYGIGCLCGMIGLYISYGAKKITDANPMHPDKGYVTAGVITNWIAVGIGILMLGVVVLAGVLYVWASDMVPENTPGQNVYDAQDAAEEAGSGSEDELIRLKMSGQDTLSWSNTKIQLSVGDNVYTCSLSGADECLITQQGGDDDNVWEQNEYIFLSESGTDICSGVGCTVDISVTYNGNTVAGDESVVVN